MNDEQTTRINNNSGGIFGSPMSIQNTQSSPLAQDEKTEEIDSLNDVFSGTQPSVSDDFSFIADDANLRQDSLETKNSFEENKKDLENLGMTVVDGVKIPETNIFDTESSFSINPQKGTVPEANQPMFRGVQVPQTVATNEIQDPIQDTVETKDLEKDFSDTFSVHPEHEQALEQVSLDAEEQKLQNMYDKLKEKADHEKVLLKKELENLKKEKEKIGARLDSVKEIEAVAAKIQEKLQNLKKIDNDIDDLEKKAQESLQ